MKPDINGPATFYWSNLKIESAYVQEKGKKTPLFDERRDQIPLQKACEMKDTVLWSPFEILCHVDLLGGTT